MLLIVRLRGSLRYTRVCYPHYYFYNMPPTVTFHRDLIYSLNNHQNKEKEGNKSTKGEIKKIYIFLKEEDPGNSLCRGLLCLERGEVLGKV